MAKCCRCSRRGRRRRRGEARALGAAHLRAHLPQRLWVERREARRHRGVDLALHLDLRLEHLARGVALHRLLQLVVVEGVQQLSGEVLRGHGGGELRVVRRAELRDEIARIVDYTS